MSLIHKFEQDGQYYVIDVNSGSFHLVDELIYDMLLDDNKLPKVEEIIASLEGKYSDEDIKEAYEDLVYLTNEGDLYSEDIFEEHAAIADNTESHIKALCLNIVHDCNLRCSYCFADKGEYHGCRKPMDFETAKKAIDFVIANSGNSKNVEVDLFGGEPMMVYDLVKQIVDYGHEVGPKHGKNIRFTMTTNATLLNDEKIEYLNKNMENVILSIDGRKEVNDKIRIRIDGTGSYDRILPNIKNLVDRRDKKNKRYYARGTFTRENTDFFKDIMHLVNEGFDEVSIEPVVLPDDHPLSLREEDLPQIFAQYDELYKEMLRRAKENDRQFKFYHFNIDLNGGPCVYKRIAGCGAGHEYVAITPDGDIYPCHQFVGDESFIIGNVEDGITKKQMSNDFKKAHIYNKPKCRECWARFYCSGGCQANNFHFNKDIHVPYEVGCKMQMKRIECAIALKTQKDLLKEGK